MATLGALLLLGSLGPNNARAWSEQNDKEPGKNDVVQAIIENVRANEVLYSNIEVSWQIAYNLERFQKRPSVLLRSAESQGRFVQQGTRFFVEVKAAHENNDGSHGKLSTREAFDGTTTRILRDDTVGNIVEGRRESTEIIRPHDLILRNSSIKVPLSTFLEGAEACRAHPKGYVFRTGWKDIFSVTEFVATERSGDRPCVHLRVTLCYMERGKRKVHSRSDLWLATDRNYIPVKKVVCNVAWAGEISGQINQISDFREIAPGVWYPTTAVQETPDDVILILKKKWVLGSRESCVIGDVKLNPKVDPALFSDVKFPASAVVYKVKNDQIVGTTLPTAIILPKETSRKSDPGNRKWMLIAFAFISGLGVITAVRWKRLRTGRRAL